MNLIDEILILIDENSHVDLDTITKILSSRSKQIISSTIGRLQAKGWIKVINSKKIKQFSLTTQGHNYLYTILGSIQALKQRKSQDSWYMVIFDVPESKRKVRDNLRKFLVEHSFGRLQSSVLISYGDKSQEISDYVKLKHLQNYLTHFAIKIIGTSKETELLSKVYWNWPEINNKYKTFMTKTDKFLQSKNKTTFNAKILVMEFAKILQKDPKLPARFTTYNPLTDKAFTSYQKIRPFCYSK